MNAAAADAYVAATLERHIVETARTPLEAATLRAWFVIVAEFTHPDPAIWRAAAQLREDRAALRARRERGELDADGYEAARRALTCGTSIEALMAMYVLERNALVAELLDPSA